MLARAGARSGRVAERDGAAGQAFTGPYYFGPLGVSTHIGAGARRDRFSTIDNRGRRCLREPAHGPREWRLPDLGISAYTPQHAPYACSHRLQLSSVHLSPFTLTRLFGGRFGVPRRPDSDACNCARATRHARQAPDRARPRGASNLDPWHRGARRHLERWVRTRHRVSRCDIR